jgi:hypothetical protein
VKDLDYWSRLNKPGQYSLERRAERYKIIKRLCSAKIGTIRENSFCVQGPKLFNCLPKEIRNLTDVRVATFKHHLDKLLTTIPDQPGVPGYAGSRAAATNSITDQLNIGGGTYGADL